jgi:hypothetical protein
MHSNRVIIFALHCINVHSARSACKGMKRENRDERTRITWNGGALVVELTVAGGDGGVMRWCCCSGRRWLLQEEEERRRNLQRLTMVTVVVADPHPIKIWVGGYGGGHTGGGGGGCSKRPR